MTVVVAVDLGGTKTAAALVDHDGVILARASTPTAARSGGEAILDATAELVAGLVVAAARAGREVAAVGVGSAGVIDAASGLVVSATDAILGWAGTDLAGGLAARFGLDVAVDNDVHAHAIGESWLGACAGRSSALLVAAGTGIGGSHLIDGRPHHGARSVAGHVGHVTVPEAVGVLCSCGRVGHVEAVASGPGLLALYRASGGSTEAVDARDVVARAGTGDDVAVRSVLTAATALGRSVGGLVNVLDPEVVVIGGGLAGAGAAWWAAMERALRDELIAPLVGLPVLPALLGTDAALVGAARLALDLLADAPAPPARLAAPPPTTDRSPA
ncbi:MAG: ROK family protein [Cellulomonas sp.]